MPAQVQTDTYCVPIRAAHFLIDPDETVVNPTNYSILARAGRNLAAGESSRATLL
jgi:hypothetical protein